MPHVRQNFGDVTLQIRNLDLSTQEGKDALDVLLVDLYNEAWNDGRDQVREAVLAVLPEFENRLKRVLE